MKKLLPNSVSNFQTIITKNYAYIDKTKFIETLENAAGNISLFLRPRRFGKTLFTEILYYYYDRSLQDQANEYLKNTYIYEHPTPNKGKYFVLKFDFSGIKSNEDLSTTLKSLKTRVIFVIANFFKNYPDLLPTMIKKEEGNSSEKVQNFYSNKNKFTNACSVLEDFLSKISIKLPNEHKLMVIMILLIKFKMRVTMLPSIIS